MANKQIVVSVLCCCILSVACEKDVVAKNEVDSNENINRAKTERKDKPKMENNISLDTIKRITKEANVDIENGVYPDQLFDSDLFTKINENPCKYKEEMKKIIRENKLNKEEEFVLQMAMIGLPMVDYISWMETAIVAYEQGRISDDALTSILFPSVNHKPEWYLDSRVKEIVDVYTKMSKNEFVGKRIKNFLAMRDQLSQ